MTAGTINKSDNNVDRGLLSESGSRMYFLKLSYRSVKVPFNGEIFYLFKSTYTVFRHTKLLGVRIIASPL